MRASRYIIIHKHREAAQKASRPMALLRGIGLTILGTILIIFAAAGLSYAFFTQSLPSLSLFKQAYNDKPDPTRFYARDGKTLLFTLAYDNFSSQDLRLCATYNQGCFPQTFVSAARIAREEAVKKGEKIPLTEEMVREVYKDYLSNSQYPDFAAKLLSFQVRQTYGTEQIESWYYNRAWFGQMAFGLDAASHLYLDKSAEELNDAECVLMSAIINAPMLNPIDSKGALRDFYLSRLEELRAAGLFSNEQADELAHSNFVIFEPPQYIDGAKPDIITHKALNTAINIYGREKVERGGMKIITSEDVSLQSYLNCITSQDNAGEETSCPLSPRYSEDEAASATETLRTAPISLAILDVNSGEILAELEANRDEGNTRVYDSELRSYPVGSSMNYFAALAAFRSGSSPSTLLWDIEASYPPNISTDSGEPFHGPIQLREALSSDYQRALEAHLQHFGSGSVRRNAALFGLSGSGNISEANLLTIGESYTAEAMAYSLSPFAAQGHQTGSNSSGSMQPISILRIETEEGETEIPQAEIRKALIADNLAYLVHNVFTQQSGDLSLPDRPSAAKIGRIKGDSALWISGYTTEISCALRVGDPKTASAFVVDGDKVLNTAEILWQSVMEKANEGRPISGWEVPEGISQVRICLPSGKLPTSACRETMTDIFLTGNEPYEYDEYYVEVPINRENRMLATRYTDPQNVVNEVFLNLPDEAADWAAANGIEEMPDSYDPIRNELINDPGILIESPAAFQNFPQNEKVDIIVRLSLPTGTESMQVSLGTGMYPTEWEEVCSGGSLENGQWLLCSLDTSKFDPGLYALRTAFILPDQSYRSAETYLQITD